MCFESGNTDGFPPRLRGISARTFIPPTENTKGDDHNAHLCLQGRGHRDSDIRQRGGISKYVVSVLHDGKRTDKMESNRTTAFALVSEIINKSWE